MPQEGMDITRITLKMEELQKRVYEFKTGLTRFNTIKYQQQISIKMLGKLLGK